MSIVAVWGKNGSGRSTFSANLAVLLAKKGYLVALVGTNKNYGSIQHYLGTEILEQKSLKKALETVNEDDIVKSFVQHGKVKDLFIMSLSNSENCLKLKTVKEDLGKRFILNTKDKFDYYIIDCTESFNDTLTMLGCQYADKIIEVIRPTIQPAAFRAGCQELLESLKLTSKIISVANNNKNYVGISDVESKLNIKFFEVLPYSKEVEKSENTGEPICMVGAASRTDKEYIRGIQRIASLIEDKENSKAKEKKGFSLLKRGEKNEK